MNPLLHKIYSQRNNEKKRALLKQRPVVIWFTGLPASGKSTLATQLETTLLEKGYLSQWLDGDDLRNGLTRDLGFTEAEQEENIRRCAEVAKLFRESGLITICSFISPTQHIRNVAREIIGAADFLEIYVNCPLEVCIQRDDKHMYTKALRGSVTNLVGVNFPYEAPRQPWLELYTHHYSIPDCLNRIWEILEPRIQVQ